MTSGHRDQKPRPFSIQGNVGVIGLNAPLSNRFLSSADMWTISSFKALPRKHFQSRFCGGRYSIIPQAQFLEILSTSEFMGGIYER